MSGYRKRFTAPLTVDGAEHVLTLRAMTYLEGLEVTDASRHLDFNDAAQKAQAVDLRGRKARQLMAAAIVSIEPPILDAEGQPVTPEELCAAVYFAGKGLMNAVSTWVNGSQPANPS